MEVNMYPFGEEHCRIPKQLRTVHDVVREKNFMVTQ